MNQLALGGSTNCAYEPVYIHSNENSTYALVTNRLATTETEQDLTAAAFWAVMGPMENDDLTLNLYNHMLALFNQARLKFDAASLLSLVPFIAFDNSLETYLPQDLRTDSAILSFPFNAQFNMQCGVLPGLDFVVFDFAILATRIFREEYPVYLSTSILCVW